jgi:hypothetical protein
MYSKPARAPVPYAPQVGEGTSDLARHHFRRVRRPEAGNLHLYLRIARDRRRLEQQITAGAGVGSVVFFFTLGRNASCG